MAKLILVYVTCANLDEAKRIAHALLEKRLIACANILPEMHSLYSWQGKLESSVESVLILKTQDGRYSMIEEVVKKMHSYELPCLLKLPIEGGHEPYLNWLIAET